MAGEISEKFPMEDQAGFSETEFTSSQEEFSTFDKISFMQDVLNANPNVSAILNKNRQVVLTNSQLIKKSGFGSVEQLIGKRPGKILSCIHNEKTECGTSENCKFCGIVNTVKESQLIDKTVSNECRITTRDNGKLVYHDFKVTCTPLQISGKSFTLLNIEDISSEKRKSVLENVFFHDILNRLGGLAGIIQLIKNYNKQSGLSEYIEMLETIGDMVIEDIQSQRYMKSAETDSLILNIRSHSSGEMLESVKKQIAFHPVMNSMGIQLNSVCEEFTFQTDGTLLKRILLNMTKNAAEATPRNGSITISCSKVENTAIFSVQNPGVIPYDTQLQIFQRSFTTKGSGRGLGTYSMKVFGENYLKGKVYFTSNEKEGTTFFFKLPLC